MRRPRNVIAHVLLQYLLPALLKDDATATLALDSGVYDELTRDISSAISAHEFFAAQFVSQSTFPGDQPDCTVPGLPQAVRHDSERCRINCHHLLFVKQTRATVPLSSIVTDKEQRWIDHQPASMSSCRAGPIEVPHGRLCEDCEAYVSSLVDELSQILYSIIDSS